MWIPGSDLVVYSSFDADAGVHLHFADAQTGVGVRIIAEGGELHVGASNDGTFVVQGPTLGALDVSDGRLVVDLGAVAHTALLAVGYAPLIECGGSPDWPTFPFSATFSSEGDRLVFDGGVTDGEREGIVVAVIGLDGAGFTFVTGLTPVDGAFSNQHNFAQVGLRWL